MSMRDRLFSNGSGSRSTEVVHATQLLQPCSKLGVSVRWFVERFVRHHNRQRDTALVLTDLEASDAHGTLSLDVAVGNLLDPLSDPTSQRLEICLRRRRPEEQHNPPPAEQPQTEESSSEKDDAARGKELALRSFELPPPNALLFTKDEFDELLNGAPRATIIVVLFEAADSAASVKFAEAYRSFAHKFHPAAVLVRSDVDENKPLAVACGVTTVPTCVFFTDRRAVDKLQGGNAMQMNVKLAKLLFPKPAKTSTSKDTWGDGLLRHHPEVEKRSE